MYRKPHRKVTKLRSNFLLILGQRQPAFEQPGLDVFVESLKEEDWLAAVRGSKRHGLELNFWNYCCIQQAEEAKLFDYNGCDNSPDKTSVQPPAKDVNTMEDTKEERNQQPVETASIEIQTDPITEGELLSLQQQKM